MTAPPPHSRTIAIIPSAGMGVRMGGRKKNFLPLLGRPALYHTLRPFEESPLISSIVVAVRPGDEELCLNDVIGPYALRKVSKVVPGGKTRQDSVERALSFAEGDSGMVVIHDGARPLVTKGLIERVLREAAAKGAAIAAVRVKDTIKEVFGEKVKKTVERENLWSVQTPQAFRTSILLNALARAREDGFVGTDESSLVERTGISVSVVEGSPENIKITTEEDIFMAECILRRRAGGQGRDGAL